MSNNWWIFLVIGLVAGYAFAAATIEDDNAVMTFGDTGLPRNCRAIIASNIFNWHAGEFTAEGALNSIERNCGAYGYSWGE